ncbi:hypothetical protein ACLKA7_001307 [Drosophila subpalustris]
MEIDDYQPLLRRRRNSYLKWTESKVLEFLQLVLDLVKDVPESLEKPTAQKFYDKFWGNFRRCVLERHSKSFQPEKAQPELHKH